MLTRGLIALVAIVGGLATPSAANAASVVDVPVTFAVTNSNHSGVPCITDGAAYTISGHLTGPASKLAAPGPKSATLYLHGLELGEWFWRVPIDGYDHTREMAKLGHISVTVDRLGYDSSSQPAGTASCVGGQADIAHQVITQLRNGTYGGATHPRLQRLALAGHSLGGSIAQVEAYSFKDIQALAVVSYADTAASPGAVLETASWGPTCLAGGASSEGGAPGYAYFTKSVDDFKANFLAHAPPAILTYALPNRDINPCGDLMSLVSPIPIAALRLHEVTVPVLLIAGSDDTVVQASGVRNQKLFYLGSRDVTVSIVNGATHGLTLEPTVVDFRGRLDSWLGARGF
ncbi:MAG: alpha/beta hydrolase [Aeromicrobium sp.]